MKKLHKKELREKYGQLFEVVRTVVHEWDPYFLLAGGAPEDEFDREIASIASQVSMIKNANNAVHTISRVFTSSFEPRGFEPENCSEVGVKLYKALVTNGFIV